MGIAKPTIPPNVNRMPRQRPTTSLGVLAVGDGPFNRPIWKVWSRTLKEYGKTTGKLRHCNMEGCNGLKVQVKWPDGKTTWPCSEGMKKYRDGMRIR